jgi:hypothetical protein
VLAGGFADSGQAEGCGIRERRRDCCYRPDYQSQRHCKYCRRLELPPWSLVCEARDIFADGYVP